MANEEQIAILKQGVEAWNQWRNQNRDIVPDLTSANFEAADLCGADLTSANLMLANLLEAKLNRSDLIAANLDAALLREADLRNTDLRHANLRNANLILADLSGARLHDANLSNALLHGADLTEAYLRFTAFGDIDLSQIKGLETIQHDGPSFVDIQSIYRSGGNIPEIFLRGIGVPDNFITYMKSLTGQAFEFYSCFISYASQDEEFAQRLYNDLQGKSVRCWFAPEDMKIGDKLRPTIDQSIRLHDKLLLILSENSIHSDWVESEVETALEEEKKRHSRQQTVLFPIRLDDTIRETDQAWAATIRRQRHIGDFTRWKEHDSYKKAFDKLLQDLKGKS